MLFACSGIMHMDKIGCAAFLLFNCKKIFLNTATSCTNLTKVQQEAIMEDKIIRKMELLKKLLY